MKREGPRAIDTRIDESSEMEFESIYPPNIKKATEKARYSFEAVLLGTSQDSNSIVHLGI